MGELIVVYDNDKELGAIVDVDNRVGWGPAMVGPGAGDILTAWLESTPFDLSDTDTYTARRYFESFLERVAGATTEVPPEVDNSAVEQQGGNGLADYAAADTEATMVGPEPPPPAPADTDEPTPAPEAAQVVKCVNCEGVGTVVIDAEGKSQACGMCHGTGKLTVMAAAE